MTRRGISLIGVLLLTGLFACGAADAEGEVAGGPEKVALHFFWASSCPHCAREKVYLTELAERKPQLEIISYEI